MRWLQPQRSSSRREKARPRRTAPHWQRVRSQAGPGSIGREDVAVSFRLAGLPVLGRPARLGGDIAEPVVSQRGAQPAAEHALRLSAQELRPGRANPPRCRPEARAAQHGRDRRRGDADPELQQLTLDAHVAHLGFSLASRLIRPRVSAASGGRPSLRPRRRRPPPCSSVRCQRRSVCGLTAKQDQRSGGSSRLAAASNARSPVVYCGRFPPRPRIASWWRSTTISSSRSPPPRASTRTRQQKSRYSKHVSTTRSLNRLGRDHPHSRPRPNRIFLPHTLAARVDPSSR
jgi:hypothetical protein